MRLRPFGSGGVQTLKEWFGDIGRGGDELGVPFVYRLDRPSPGGAVAELDKLARTAVVVPMTAVQ